MKSKLLFATLCGGALCANATLPVGTAPFEREGVKRCATKLVSRPFSYKTNFWESADFVCGTRRLIVSGADSKIDCNNPLRFGRIIVMDGREQVAQLVIAVDGEWDTKVHEGDELVVNKEKGTATWSRKWPKGDGTFARFTYTVTAQDDAKVVIDYDVGVSAAEAAQLKRIPVSSRLYIEPTYALNSEYGFGDEIHEFYPEQEILAKKQTQMNLPLRAKSNTFNFEERNALKFWSLTFPDGCAQYGTCIDYLTKMVNNKPYGRGVMYMFPLAPNAKLGLKTKGRFVFDLGQSAVPKVQGYPAVGGLDFWEFDAVHVPQPPTRNWLSNGSFEQGLKNWRWDDWGAEYTKPDKGLPREEVAEGGKFGRHALVLRGSQYICPALCSAPMPLEPGEKYTISCWAKSLSDKPQHFRMDVRSVNRNAKYFQFKGQNDFPSFKVSSEWQQFHHTFTADAGGFFLRLCAPGGNADNAVLIDGVQVEKGEKATDFAEAPFVAHLVSSNRYNDLKPGDDYALALDVQSFAKVPGSMKVTVKNFYDEVKFEQSFELKGDARIPLNVVPTALGKGIFVVRMDFTCGAQTWTDYARFSVLKPLDGKQPVAQFFANHAWYQRVSRAEHFIKKYVEWGWNSTDGRNNYYTTKSAFAPLAKQLNIRNYVHPVAYERAFLQNLATNLPSGVKLEGKDALNFHTWTGTPAQLELIEVAAYHLAKECAPEDDIWTFWNEEESWARKVGFDVHCKFVQAVRRGVIKAFKERGLPAPRFCESHGTSHYFNGRNYDAIEGYLAAADKAGFKYDVVTIHPYQNIDGGTLGPKDSDLETQHLIKQMKEHGYPDSTPIMFTECFNMHPVRIPPWGADGWGDSYRANTQPSQDRGRREFIMAASQCRLYVIALKFYPKVQLVHPWNTSPTLDVDFAPYSFILAANTLQHLMPSPKFYGDAQPYGDVRGYCFMQGDNAVMPIWTTNHDIEWGTKPASVIQMVLPRDTKFVDMEGNEREPDSVTLPGNFITRRWAKTKIVRVPLTPAPLFLISKEPEALLNALKNAVAEDPSTALSVDVRPDAASRVNLVLQNETKAQQKGALQVSGATIPYDIAPRGKVSMPLASGNTQPMQLQTWRGTISILPNPWEIKYFFVPKCGAQPDWSKIPSQPLTTIKGSPHKDSRAEYKMAWNKDFLFVRVEMKDPDFITTDTNSKDFVPTALYANDGCLEVYFDGFANARAQGQKDYDLDDSRYDFLGQEVHRFLAVNWQLAQGTASATDQEIKDKLVRKFTRTASGYVYEIAFAARYMAPVDLKPGTVAGVGVCLHDYTREAGKARKHGNLSNATRQGADCDKKPYLWPTFILAE